MLNFGEERVFLQFLNLFPTQPRNLTYFVKIIIARFHSQCCLYKAFVNTFKRHPLCSLQYSINYTKNMFQPFLVFKRLSHKSKFCRVQHFREQNLPTNSPRANDQKSQAFKTGWSLKYSDNNCFIFCASIIRIVLMANIRKKKYNETILLS